MNINKCAKCGKLFPSSEDLCNTCLAQDLQDLATVRNFFLNNTGRYTLDQLSNLTGVKEKDILRYISKGRLDDIEHLGSYFKCIYCKEPIRKGKYCNNCMGKFETIKKQLLNDTE